MGISVGVRKRDGDFCWCEREGWGFLFVRERGMGISVCERERWGQGSRGEISGAVSVRLYTRSGWWPFHSEV